MAKLSKISSLPRLVRDELNRRMDDGQRGPELLSWINGLAEVREILAKQYRGIEISDQNLSVWRETGFCEWQKGQEHHERLQGLCDMSRKLGGKSGGILGGSSAIASGHILELLEDLDIDAQREMLAEKPETFLEFVSALTKLRQAEAQAGRLALAKEKSQRDDQRLKLDREKFEIMAAQALLKHARSPEVQAILKGNGSNEAKIKALRAAIFPQRPHQPELPQ